MAAVQGVVHPLRAAAGDTRNEEAAATQRHIRLSSLKGWKRGGKSVDEGISGGAQRNGYNQGRMDRVGSLSMAYTNSSCMDTRWHHTVVHFILIVQSQSSPW